RLVANVHSRFYLNLSDFMRIAAQVPGLTPRALLTASGGATDATIRALEAQTAEISHRGFLLRLPLTAPRELARQSQLDREVDALAQVLVGGVRELESAQPGIALARMAQIARDEPEAAARILARAVKRPGDLPDGPARRALAAFLDEFGDRAVREAELATPR